MKKLLLILVLLCGILPDAPGQGPTQRMKAIHMAALRIADGIGVPEAKRADFVALYQAFKKESVAVLSEKPAVTGDAENDAEAKILSDFDKSAQLLSLRKAYYQKFRAILSPSQIQAMYDMEKQHSGR
ncbi:MAG: hypothetical protein IJV01_04885 [Bacteroidales bacterium]|nr:hypothetical protein [Bacteroidales bacterium]